MITKKKDAQEKLDQYIHIFLPLRDKELELTFDTHCFQGVIIEDIIMGKISDIDVDFGKRLDTDKDKMRSPMIFHICTDVGRITLPFDDIHVSSLGPDKVRITVQQDKGKPIIIEFKAMV